ncbi:MAG: GTPase [Verrucomicrobiota bacterium]|jgi:GTP-binding protein
MNRQNGLPAVAIVGRPNVGKSALFNRLVGRKIAIVHDQPGVTRDRLSAVCSRGEQPFLLWDTGGIGGAGERELTRHVHGVVKEAMDDSDVLLFMVDAQHGLSPIDEELARLLRRSRKPTVLVINKVDDPKHENLAPEFSALGFDLSLPISAAHGIGTSELLETIETLLPDAVEPTEHNDRSPALEKALPIAIVGRPNVGKSSFINAIVQSDRAIVSELPGTTRDAVDIAYQQNNEAFLFIDTAGMRKRARHSTSVEVFSVMRSERSIRRAKLCVLMIDATTGVTAQDKTIAGLIQDAEKAALVVVNKFDLVKSGAGRGKTIEELVQDARERLFFLDYAPVLVSSALTGQHVEKLFKLIRKVQRAARVKIGTGVLNRLLRAAFDANPPPMVSGKRLKLFYATQSNEAVDDQALAPAEFVLFVNEPRLLNQNYRRYLEGRIRGAAPYEGLPVILKCRARTETRKR